MRFPPTTIRLADDVPPATLASLPEDLRDLVRRAAWTVRCRSAARRTGVVDCNLEVVPNAAARVLLRRWGDA